MHSLEHSVEWKYFLHYTLKYVLLSQGFFSFELPLTVKLYSQKSKNIHRYNNGAAIKDKDTTCWDTSVISAWFCSDTSLAKTSQTLTQLHPRSNLKQFNSCVTPYSHHWVSISGVLSLMPGLFQVVHPSQAATNVLCPCSVIFAQGWGWSKEAREEWAQLLLALICVLLWVNRSDSSLALATDLQKFMHELHFAHGSDSADYNGVPHAWSEWVYVFAALEPHCGGLQEEWAPVKTMEFWITQP